MKSRKEKVMEKIAGPCPVAGFGMSGVEPWGSATTVLVRSYGDRF
jgi:hypothetical protein